MSNLKYRIAQRIGNLQLIAYIGKDESASNNHIYEARCSCGRNEKVSSHELSTGRKVACSTCAPPVRAESPREWLQAERQRIADEEERKRQDEILRQRQAEEQRVEAIRQRQREFINDSGEFAPKPVDPNEPVWDFYLSRWTYPNLGGK